MAARRSRNHRANGQQKPNILMVVAVVPGQKKYRSAKPKRKFSGGR